jgi:hypothetical protein
MSASSLIENRLVRVERDEHWTSWIDPSWSPSNTTWQTLGQPGLWRAVRASSGRLVASFDCPSVAILRSLSDTVPEELARLDADLVDWMITTSAGAEPQALYGPPRDEVTSWIDESRLSVRAGDALTRGRIDCEGDRLRIRFPDIVCLDPELSPARLDWLRELCLDAQSRWQLVRFGLRGERVCAEVDLCGAPIELLPPLTVWAVEALRVAIEWALPGCALLADPALVCPLLDTPPWWTGDQERAASGPDGSPAA